MQLGLFGYSPRLFGPVTRHTYVVPVLLYLLHAVMGSLLQRRLRLFFGTVWVKGNTWTELGILLRQSEII